MVLTFALMVSSILLGLFVAALIHSALRRISSAPKNKLTVWPGGFISVAQGGQRAMGLLTGCSARSRSPSLASRGFACDGAVKGQTKTALGTSKR